jgi:NADH dehydrogenase/NADH:ubiquinone oxidoreductase subunit G
MGNMVNLTIDGKQTTVPEGTKILDAAESVGIHIPNLCYIKGMKGIGACRLCLVEVEGGKAPVVSCNIKVKDGMNISTNTEKVQEIRKFVIDLILSMHPLDCMTCTKAGVCSLQQYAYDFELKESSFSRKKFGYPTDEENPFIKRDPEYCILCSRCIRICKAQGTEVLDFQGRGVGAKVVTANDRPLQESTCTFCGSCVDACPVNALLEADRWRKGREWEYEKIDSICLSCGNSCNISVSTKEGEVIKINTGTPEGRAERFICAIGRFGFDSLTSDVRVTAPLMRENGELKETTWDNAIKVVADRLKKAGTEASFISSANILNEDAVMLKRLADAVKSKDCDSSVSLYADYGSMKSGDADLEHADLFILAGIAPEQWKRVLPALDAIVRKRMNNDKAKLIVINSDEPKIASAATVFLKGDEAQLLQELSQAMIAKGVKAPKEMVGALASVDPSDSAMEAAEIIKEANAPVILSSPALYKAAANVSLIKGEAVAVPFEANAKGVVLSGLVSKGKKFSEMVSTSSKVLYVVGEVPVGKRPETDFLVVQNAHMTDLATEADVVLPSTPPLESEGTIIDYLGRLKTVKKTIEPSGESRRHTEIFIDVAEAVGKEIKMVKDTEIKKAAKAKEKPVFSDFKKVKGLDIDAEQFMEDINKTTVNSSRLLWLKELEKAVPA